MTSGPVPMRAPPPRAAYVVLGMHRSGTSSVAGALARLGAAPPRTLMRPAQDNPRGFWESEVIAALNDRILAARGSNWHDWRPLDTSGAAVFADEAADALTQEFGDAGAVVLKDPRICRLYPFWRGVLEAAGYEPLVVSPVRDPLEVAASLGARSGMPRPVALRLWLRHVLEAERTSRGRPRHLMDWADFMDDWRGQMALMGTRLGRALDFDAARASEADAFLTPDLRRQKAEADADVPAPVHRVRSLLGDLARHGEHPDLHAGLDAARAAFDAACGLFVDAPRGAGADG